MLPSQAPEAAHSEGGRRIRTFGVSVTFMKAYSILQLLQFVIGYYIYFESLKSKEDV